LRLVALESDKVDRFWQWFAQNATRMTRVETDMTLSNEIARELRRIHQPDDYVGNGPCLGFDFGEKKDGQRELIITAHGIISALHLATRLADSAPPIPGWRVSALVRRKNTDRLLNEYQLGPDDVWFKHEIVDARLNLTVFVINLPEEKEHDILAIRDLLIYTLGEEVFAKKINVFDCQRLPTDPEIWSLRRLRELPEIADKL